MQNLNQKTVNTLNKGLITEAGELTFPESATIDELNCSLSRDGSRSRRFGLELEAGAEDSSFAVSETETFTVGEWANPGGISGLVFMVIQTGENLYFYDSGQAPYSNQYTGLSVDLTPFQISGGDVTLAKCQFATIAGALVVASPAMDTIYLSYNGVSISTTQIEFRVRDFDWMSDVCDLTEKITNANITSTRKYDTLNSGWVGNSGSTLETWSGVSVPSGLGLSALKNYNSAYSAWPPLTHPWYSGKDSGGDFSRDEWEKVYSGSSLMGNGHFILDFFIKDRNTAAGTTGVTTETESSRFSTVATYASRMFYAGLGVGNNSGRILYSRLVETVKDTSSCTIIGECYQQNDPTAEYYSDLLETDGGVIHIPDAFNIKKLYTHNQYLYVFAENGVWVVSGPDSRFSATSYYVSKVSNLGIFSEGSFVAAEGVPFWWSKYGIHTFSYDETSGFPMEQNLSISTVQSFWDSLDTNAKTQVAATYDRVNKQIFWLYPENSETKLNRRNRVLILDIPLQAFYPWELSYTTMYPMGLFFFDSYGSESFADEVLDSLGDAVTDSTLATVTVTRYNLLSSANTRLGVVTFKDDAMTISLFSSKTFLDFVTEDYDCYVEAGYDFGGDLLLKKSVPYITTYCRVTEEGFTSAPNYDVINPSGLFLEAYWDFKDYSSTRQQIYRPKPTPVVDTTNISDNGQNKSVVTSRLKVRGSGRSLRLRFVAEEGKNFVLLGYSVLIGANARF